MRMCFISFCQRSISYHWLEEQLFECLFWWKTMVEGVGIAEYFGIGEALGIIGTMFVVLYFSGKQMQSLSVDIQTKVLNDLDEKVHKMAEIIIEKPSMQKVTYKLENPSEELAFAYYILFICSHAYAMHQRKVLNDDEWQDGYSGWEIALSMEL